MTRIEDLILAQAQARPAAPALWDDAAPGPVDFAELARRIAAFRAHFARRPRPLVLALADPAADVVAGWLGAFAAGGVVALVNPDLPPATLRALDAAYRPDFWLRAAGRAAPFEELAWTPCGGAALAEAHGGQPAPHPDLALLLFTSGSTGAPKAVRLGAAGVAHGARAIAASLDLGPDARAALHLPPHYSYGMSVIHSHLAVGASAMLTALSPARATFWARARAVEATTFPGVPAHYQLLETLKFAPETLCPSLRSMTQAGGRLPEATVRRFAALMAARGGAFHVMYGQTEAGPRIACHAVAPDGPADAAGRALDGGRLFVRDEDGRTLGVGEIGEICYAGPNVMMGYAEGRDDLGAGDTVGGVLATGDMGRLDAGGLLFVTGRSKRFAKVAGLRCNLDHLERLAAGIAAPVAALTAGDRLALVWERASAPDLRAAARRLCAETSLPAAALQPMVVERLPLLPSGKPDYAALRQAAGLPDA